MKTCQKCKGDRHIEVRLRDKSGKRPDSCLVPHIVACDMCDGKGYTDQSDQDRYLRGMGVYPGWAEDTKVRTA